MCGTVALLLSFIDREKLLDGLTQVSLGVILASVALGIVRTWLVGNRWRILNPDPSGQVTTWDYFRYMMIGNTYNLLMPGQMGGDLSRVILVSREVQEDRASNVFSILVDRMIGITSIIALGLVACLMAPALPQRSSYLAMILVVAAVFGIAGALVTARTPNRILRRCLSKAGRWGKSATRVVELWETALDFYRERSSRMLLALALCVPIHATTFLILHLFSLELGISVSFLSLSTVMVLVWVITVLPITFAGIGVREVSFVYLLSLQSVPPEQATALSLCFFLATVLLALLGIPFLLLRRKTSAHDPARPGP